MEFVLLVIGVITLLGLVFMVIEFKIGLSKIKNLTSQMVSAEEQLPSISIIFSALNEETALKNALDSMLALNYPKLEIIAVNDRSTDSTPAILNEFKHYSRLKIHHISHLPKGWLGKNHALHVAAQMAKNDWLLFTDADVIMKTDALLKAMSYTLENNIDHLTIYEHHIRKGFWLKILLLGSYITYCLSMKPWRIRYRWSNKYLGHGAFNLIKKSVYEKCGGHQAIAMECLDDLKLGHLVKKNGYQQDTVDGKDYIEREWYSSMPEMIQGLQKNAFAYFNFNIFAYLRDMTACLIFYFLPFFVIITYSGTLQWINILNVLLNGYLTIEIAKHFRIQKRYAIFYPFSIALLLYTTWNSVKTTYKHNGVIWRDTFYSLQELRYKK